MTQTCDGEIQGEHWPTPEEEAIKAEREAPRDDIPEVVIVVNGALGMGAGKIAGQAFQAAHRMLIFYSQLRQEIPLYKEWKKIGTRTVVKQAKTQAMFDRIRREVPGYTMVDEGFTEVEPNTATVFVSRPFLHKDRPQVLDNKKVPLL